MDGDGRISDFSNMEAQMRQSYANAAKVLSHFGVTADDIVEDVLYAQLVEISFVIKR